jgi:hypothetical protein
LVAGAGALAVGCGAQSSGGPAAPDADALPAVVDQGGPTLNTPHIVTVTWAADDAGATMRDFDRKIGASSYWKQATSEYGIGTASATDVIIQAPPPATWDDTQIDGWVQSQVMSSSAGWPQPDGETMYVVFLPASVKLTSMGQDACASYGGYHTDLGGNPDIVYALVPEACYQGTAFSLVDNATSSAAHEIVETATDPFGNESPAYLGFDANHVTWELWTDWQDELADACEFRSDAYYKEGADLPYVVARIWSNAAAAAGRDPCAPRVGGAFVDVQPQGQEDLSVQAVGSDGKTVSGFTARGWHIAPGQTRKVSVMLSTDQPSGSWNVIAGEGDCCNSPAGLLAISPTTFTGNAGDTFELSITVKAAPKVGTAIPMAFESRSGQTIHLRPALVGAY